MFLHWSKRSLSLVGQLIHKATEFADLLFAIWKTSKIESQRIVPFYLSPFFFTLNPPPHLYFQYCHPFPKFPSSSYILFGPRMHFTKYRSAIGAIIMNPPIYIYIYIFWYSILDSIHETEFHWWYLKGRNHQSHIHPYVLNLKTCIPYLHLLIIFFISSSD